LEHSRGETGRAIDAVRIRMARSETGRVRVHVPARGECAVYLMDGELIAALTDRDALAIVDRLVARGRMSAEDAGALRVQAKRGPLGFDALHKVIDADLVGRLMGGRFRDNLVHYLFDGGRFVFEPMDTVRVPHLQMGHDSAGLLRELEMVHERIRPWIGLERRRRVGMGPHTPGSPQQRHIQALCASGVMLEPLLQSSPFFVSQTLVLVAQMVDAGSLETSEVEADDGPAPEAIDHALKAAAMQRERRKAAAKEAPSILPAFADHEQEDRGLGLGAFRGDKDRVDLGRTTASKRPGLRMTAPQLSQSEVSRRVGVCNEVLTGLAAAWTAQHGPGEGRRIAQLLVDGAPLSTAALFRAVQVDAKGRLGPAQVLKNLERRPGPERRELLTKGLSDLIDRSLAKAAEGLDEDKLSTMLQQVAGYRERMGW
jgi:hypothetical protein